MYDTQVADPAAGTAPPADADTAGTGAASGILAGAVGALPALGPALASACAGCLGAAPAAATGAAAGAGVTAFGIGAGLVVLAVVVGLQLRRVRQSCPVGGGSASRQSLRSMAAITVVAGLSFALMQWVVAPALTRASPDVPAGEQLP